MGMKLFETTTLNGMVLANRFVRAATWEGMASDEGACLPKLIALMEELVCGGVGLIITGHAYVSREGQAGPWQLGACSDDLLPGLTEMTRTVHREGGKIALQLAHAGCHPYSKLACLDALGPSPLENKQGSFCREMTLGEIQETVKAFGKAAGRAQKAGFDGIEIHGAHGYLLSQFLSPYYNRRRDGYGGSLGNRARIVLEVLEAIRTSVGRGFPVLFKINSEDFLDGGFSVEEMLEVVSSLEKAGVDAIELSGGTKLSGKYIPIRKGEINSKEKEVYYREAAKKYRQKVNVPLILAGGIRSYEVAEECIDKGLADYISLCRPLICEPHLIKRWKSGDRRRAACLSDNRCIKPVIKGKGLYCRSAAP